MGSNTRSIYAEIRIDWEDYDDVMDELVLEDAIDSVKDGVDIYVVPNYSTLIAEHKLMKEALKKIGGGHAEAWSKDVANKTLKQLSDGK